MGAHCGCWNVLWHESVGGTWALFLPAGYGFFDARRDENMRYAHSTEAYEGGVGARWQRPLSIGVA